MLKREEVFAYTSACYNGEPASCSYACPFRVDLRSVMKKVAKGKLSAAAKDLRQALPFPRTISTLCSRPCEKHCQRFTVAGEAPLAIGWIEQACLAAPEKKERPAFKPPLQTRRVAVVGAGLAGLTCALYLERKRFAVTIFDRLGSRGGSLQTHPAFAAFEEEFCRLLDCSDIAFHMNTEIRSMEELADFDAVCLCTGSGGSTFGLTADDSGLGLTENARVFLCGECTGADRLSGAAAALSVSRAVEALLQSGDPLYAKESQNLKLCSRYVPHGDIPPSKTVSPGENGYTPEQATAEAGRCLQCDCEACMQACELLIRYKKKPPRIAQDVAQDGQTRNSVSSASITRQTWSCNLCGRCGSLCREGVDLSGLFELSRRDRVSNGLYPPALHAFRLREYKLSTEQAALLIPGESGNSCRYLFFPGCRLGASTPNHVKTIFAFLRQQSPDTGLMLNCCGVPALWAGDGCSFDRQIAFLRESWQQLGRPTILYACASCRKTLTRFLPEIPLEPVYAHIPLSRAAAERPAYAVFDPCAAAGAEDLKTAVRDLATGSGLILTDYDSGGKCCGFGGHMQLANPELYDEITSARCQETDAPFLVYCTNCAEIFQKAGKNCLHILDAVLGYSPTTVPTLEQKRSNALTLRQELEKEYLGQNFYPAALPGEELTLRIDPDALASMENRLVPECDVRLAIHQAEADGNGFENEDGDILCRIPGPILTCWVKYHAEGGGFRVKDVYTHRMHIREEEDCP